MDADAPNAISPLISSQAEQLLIAPPGWTKKLVPAKGKYVTLRKHDVIFVAPDGQEVPGQWHLRRYLKAHPEGPAFSDFDWNSGEESVRRSARVSTRESNVIETPTPPKKRKAKRTASEMDAEGEEEVKVKTASEMDVEGEEEVKVKTPARKRAKKANEPADAAGASAVKDEARLPDKDEAMREAGETPVSGKPDNRDAAPVTDVMKEGVVAEMGLAKTVPDGQKEGSNSVKAPTETDTDAQNATDTEKVSDEGGEAQGEPENGPSIIATDVLMEEEPKIVEGEKAVEVEKQDQEVKIVDQEPEIAPEPKGASGSGLISTDELKGEAVVESEKPLEPSGETEVGIKEPVVQKDDLKVMSDTHVSDEHHEAEKKSLEPLMQKEELERLHSGDNPSVKVGHMKEKSPNDLSSSPAPLSVGNQ